MPAAAAASQMCSLGPTWIVRSSPVGRTNVTSNFLSTFLVYGRTRDPAWPHSQAGVGVRNLRIVELGVFAVGGVAGFAATEVSGRD